MSNKTAAAVREPAAVDPRIARTTHALGRALIDLIQERDYRDITVQQILDRAGVGRATFYAHYRNKEDALHSSYERLFALMEPLAARPSPLGPRLFPVTEFLQHVGEQQRLVEGLRRAGRWEEVWSIFAAHAARIIERRIASWPGIDTTIPRSLAARMLGGALMETMKWWEERPSVATPAEMDVAFHELARGVLRARPVTRR